MKKIIVIGAGPAGITAAIYAKRGGLEVTVFNMKIGALGKAKKIDNYYGFPNGISGQQLMKNGLEQAANLGIEIIEKEVVGLELTTKFNVETKEGSKEGDAVIIAMGSPRKVPKVKNIEKYEGRGVSYCAVCDGFFFKGKKVAVLGTGDYATHEVDVLKPFVESVTMIDDAEAVEGKDVLEKIILKNGKEIEASGLFVAMGSAGSVDLAKKIGTPTEGNKIITDEKMATSIPGLYSAGDCNGGLTQVAKAVHEGAVAGLAAVDYLK